MAESLDIKVAKIETKVEAIKEDVDSTVDELKIIHGRITEGNEKILDKLGTMTHVTNDQHSDILAKMETMDRRINGRISALERWRYWVLGAAVAAAWLISNIPLLGLLR